jgi:hypothetical protein
MYFVMMSAVIMYVLMLSVVAPGSKHSGLLRYGNNYGRVEFYSTDPWGHCYNTILRYIIAVILTLFFLGLKYRGNLLPFHCNLQGNIAL